MPRPGAEAQTRRNQAIIYDRARGLGWTSIAERHRLSTRQAQKIWARRLEQQHDQTGDVLTQVFEELAYLEAAVEELAELASDSKNDAVRLGAIKAKIDAQGKRVELKRILGLLPSRLENIRLASESQKVINGFFEALEETSLEWAPGKFEEYVATAHRLIFEDPKVEVARKKAAQERDRRALQNERRAHQRAERRANSETSHNGGTDSGVDA